MVRVRLVGLLDVAQHFAIELLLQALCRSHPGFRIGVLGFQVGGDFLGVLVTQPGVVIVQRVAMKRDGIWVAASDRRVR